MITHFRAKALYLYFPALLLALLLLSQQGANATTSPYVTVENNVPLNQSTNDTVNGVLPYFTSHTAVEGNFSSLTDASSATAPDGNVILGPDNTWVGVAWDFGVPPVGFMWRLDRFDAWITGEDNTRKGYRGDLSVSTTGDPAEFQVITNSQHDDGLTQNAQFNHVRYDFPSAFVAGETPDKDKHAVTGFRYLRLNSRGAKISDVDWQSRFVEFDIWVTAIPAPSDAPTITAVAKEEGAIRITWSAISGRNYDVEYKAGLDVVGWSLLNSLTAGGSSASTTDNSIGEAERYYRIVLQP